MEGGKAHGYGTLTYEDGEKYVGEWKNDNKHGQGTYTKANGTIAHSGEWVNDEPKTEVDLLESDIIARAEAAENKITKNYDSGAVYCGQMEGDQRHGYGTYTYYNGNTYVGEFKNGERDGNGTYTYTYGIQKYVGEWTYGNKHGQGTYINADGTIYHSGEWENNAPKE